MAGMVDKVINHVMVVIAMEAEAKPFVESQGLTPIPTAIEHAPSSIFGTTKPNGQQITVVVNNKCPTHGVDYVGTVPAALSTFLAIEQFHPDIVINAGTCGGFASKGSKICDAYITTHAKNHDRRIPIPGFTEYGIGGHESISCPNLVETLGLKTGVVSTANSLDHTEMDDIMMAANDASCKDMEAAAIAWVCSLSSTPFFALKVVTDIVDGDRPSQDEFLHNLHAAASTLEQTLPRVLTHVLGRNLADL